MPQLDHLPNHTTTAIKKTVDGLRETFGNRLRCAALVGPSADATRVDVASSTPVIVALSSEADTKDLRKLAKALADPIKRDVHVHVLTVDEFDKSRDVFALKIADWRDRHILLDGEDILCRAAVQRTDLRAALEREWRGFRMALRDRLLQALTVGLAGPNAQKALRTSFDGLLLLAHHTLVLLGAYVPTDEAETLQEMGNVMETDTSALLNAFTTFQIKHRHQNPTEVLDLIDALATVATAKVDALQI